MALRAKTLLDFPEFRTAIGDDNPESRYYGPSSCEGCGYPSIIKHAIEHGAESWETPCMRNEHKYTPHHCTHVKLFKSLAGKVLTVIDASFPQDSRQLKAIKDLLKKSFSETIANVKYLEGDTSQSSSDSSFEKPADML